MGLSSNILWHQTSFMALECILHEQRLRFAYSVETLRGEKKSICYAYPMISICDLPISEIGEYLGRYGDCSIGFTREWVEHNRFNPVWYCSSTAYPLNNLLGRISVLDEPKGENVSLKTLLYNQLAFIKNIEGPLASRNYVVYRFYDEREYRLALTPCIIKNSGVEDVELYLTEQEYENYKNTNGSSLLDERLNVLFHRNDIFCIIVKDDIQKRAVSSYLRDIDFRQVHIFLEEEVKSNFIGLGHNKKV